MCAGLLGERFIPVIRDAQARGWLAPGCRVVPSRARVVGMLVESSYLRRMTRLDAAACGFALPTDIADDLGSASPYDIPLGRLLQSGQARALSSPFEAWDIGFDLAGLPPAGGRSKRIHVQATRCGRVDAIAFWWECDLVGDGADLAYRMGEQIQAAADRDEPGPDPPRQFAQRARIDAIAIGIDGGGMGLQPV